MDQLLVVDMRFEQYLSVNDRYSRGTRPRLRPKCAAWQEELAWKIKEQRAHSTFVWPDDVVLVIDVEMRFPKDGRERDSDNYLKSIMDGLEAGLGVSDSHFIPFIREVQVVEHPEMAGFTIRVYRREFAGHRLRGRVALTMEGQTCIVLDEILPTEWLSERVCVNIGMIEEG